MEKQVIMTNEKLRVLVVDDYLAGCLVLAEQLDFFGHEAETVGSGAAALVKLRARHFDLLITDWLMPGMTGAELAIAAKAIDPDLPIIIVTALDDPMNLSGEPPAGVDLVLSKPVQMRELRAAIDTVIGKDSGNEQVVRNGEAMGA